MPPLTQDEFTVLLLAEAGESMIPLGRWKTPVLALTEREWMQCHNAVNYGITLEGRKAVFEQNEADEADLRRLLAGNSKTIEARDPIDEFFTEELKNG
jgi:hypothetical protein